MPTTKVIPAANGGVTVQGFEDLQNEHKIVHEEIEVAMDAYRMAVADKAHEDVLWELSDIIEETYTDYLASSHHLIEYLQNSLERKATIFPASFVRECAKHEIDM